MIDLQRFCADQDAIYSIQEPWSDGAYTYATNGMVIIRVSRRETVPERIDAPNVNHDEIAKWFTKEPKSWNAIPAFEVKREICQWCNGVGAIDCFPCEDCAGTGREIIEEEIEIGATWFSNWLLELIKELPNCKIGVNSYPDPCRFVFDGGDGLIMPRKHN